MILYAFVEMRHFIADNAIVLQHLRDIDLKLLEHDEKIGQVLKQLEEPREKKAVIFSGGQLWDATSCIEDIFKKAKKSITMTVFLKQCVQMTLKKYFLIQNTLLNTMTFT